MRYLALILLFLFVSISNAQNPLAAALEIIHDGVEIRLKGTEQWLRLGDGAITAFGAGDILRTNALGRAWLNFGESGNLLLLPNSEFSFETYDESEFKGAISGVAILEWAGTEALSLEIGELELNGLNGNAALWSNLDETAIVTVAEGEANLNTEAGEILVSAGEGYRQGEEAVLALEAPYNAARLIGILDGCTGLIETDEGRGVLVRTGAGRGYQRRGLIEDSGEAVLLARTATSAWTRIQYGNGFGWVTSIAVQSTCDLPILPDNAPEEDLTRVINADERELAILFPYFDSPALDGFFYGFDD